MMFEKMRAIMLGKTGIFASLVILIFVFILPRDIKIDGATRSCTSEAKMCPDGSVVGRSGPDCIFDKCPNDQIVFAPTKGAANEVKAATKEGLVVTCTTEARTCPDGSFSLRLPPGCNFAPCR